MDLESRVITRMEDLWIIPMLMDTKLGRQYSRQSSHGHLIAPYLTLHITCFVRNCEWEADSRSQRPFNLAKPACRMVGDWAGVLQLHDKVGDLIARETVRGKISSILHVPIKSVTWRILRISPLHSQNQPSKPV